MIFENDNQYNKPTNERRSRITNPTPYIGLGKLPPQATDLEEVVLGAIMIEKDAFMYVSSFLKAEMFYRDSHQKIYNSCFQLFSSGDPIDMATVVAKLRSNGELDMIGGAYAIAELTSRVSSSANIEFHARIIMQKYMQREIIRINTESIQSAYEDTTDVLELSERLQMEIYKLNDFKNGKKVRLASDIIAERILEYHKKPTGSITGMSSGISSLDHLTNGWQKGDLIIIAGRPAMGKTAFVLTCAKTPAKAGKPVLIEELEMTSEQLIDRLISGESGINQDDILRHNLDAFDFAVLDEKLKNIIASKIFVDDTAGQNIVGLRSKAILHKQKYGIELIIVDYLQLMEVEEKKGQNREQGLGAISRGLKKIAKELNVPVIALSQLSRAVEERADKTPRLSDLRESGSIEQDADMVIFLLRPEYYGIKEYEGESTKQLCLAIIAKNRQGVCDIAKMKFNGALMTFENWNSEQLTPIERQPTF